MAIRVLKFGGTSLADLERCRVVAGIIAETQSQGNQVCVVVSAMGHETDRLLQHAESVQAPPRERAVLLASGEPYSAATLASICQQSGINAVSFQSWQLPILCTNQYEGARMTSIDVRSLLKAIDHGVIPIVVGFQGINEAGELVTIGRGGSDATAVALSAALGADACVIYSDVDGVCTTDPNMEKSARVIEKIHYEEMLEMAGDGAGVLHVRSVELAHRYHVPLRVCSSFKKSTGTEISAAVINDKPLITGIAFSSNQSRIMIRGMASHTPQHALIMDTLAGMNVDVDMMVQSLWPSGESDMAMTIARSRYQEVRTVLSDLLQDRCEGVYGVYESAKVSIIGSGMKSQPGVAAKMMKFLGDIEMTMITTSEIRISVAIAPVDLEKAVQRLHTGFELSREEYLIE